MITRILVGYDGSQSAEAALAFARELADRFAAELHVLCVVRPPDFADDVETESLVEHGQQRMAAVVDALKGRFAGGPEPRFAVVTGHAAEQIVLYAERNLIDHIVVGHRGHSLFDRWLLGSVAKRVVSYAPCAVTVVRPVAR